MNNEYRRARRMAGLTLPQAARVAHVCPRAWSYYESGQRKNWPALRAFVAETGLPWPLPEIEGNLVMSCAPNLGEMVILLDVDGVICDFFSAYKSAVCDAIPDFPERRLRALRRNGGEYSKQLELDRVDNRRVWDLLKAPLRGRTFPAFAGAAEGVVELMAYHQVFFVTAQVPGGSWMNDRIEWLWEQIGIRLQALDAARAENFRSRVIFCAGRHKRLVRGDVFVDDREDTVEQWGACNPSGRGVWAKPGVTFNWAALCEDVGKGTLTLREKA